MRMEIDENNLCVSVDADVKVNDLQNFLKNANYSLPIYPAKKDITVKEWIENETANFGSYKYGGLYSSLRSAKILVGEDEIETGFKVSNFGSGIDLNALIINSRGTLGELKSAIFKIVPFNEKRTLSYEFESINEFENSLTKLINSKSSPYSISFNIYKKIIINIIVETKEEEKFVEEVFKNAVKTKEEEIFFDKEVIGEWILPLENIYSLAKEIYMKVILIDRSTAYISISGARDEQIHEDISDYVRKCNGKIVFPKNLKKELEINGKYALFVNSAIKKVFDPFLKVKKEEEITKLSKETEELTPYGFTHFFPMPFKKGLSELQKKELKNLFEDRITFDVFDRLCYISDLAPLPKEIAIAFKTMPDAVVRTKTTEEIVKLMKFSSENEIPITPRGSASWGFGGAISTQGGIVLDLTAMNEILELNKENFYVVVQCGTTWKKLIEKLNEEGFILGAYPSSFPAATIGGWIANGGAGIGNYKYGSAIEQCRNLKIVFYNGEVINTAYNKISSPLFYNLNGLFVGSEGTLGIISEITLRIYPKGEFLPLSYSFNELKDASLPIIKLARKNVFPYNISITDEKHYFFLKEIGEEIPNINSTINIILEGTKEENERDEKIIDEIMINGVKQKKEFAKREMEEISYELRARRLGPGGALGEVVIPVKNFSKMVEKTKEIVKELKMNVAMNSSLIDKNSLAFKPYYILDARDMIKSMMAMGFVKKFMDEGIELGGKPTGLGIWFASSLEKFHSKKNLIKRAIEGDETADLIRDFKTAFDPYLLINPGKHTEIRTRFGIAIPPFAMDIILSFLAKFKGMFPEDKIKKEEKGVEL